MRKLIFFTIIILVVNQLPAQKTFKRNTLYTELAGNGMVISANWERQLGTKPGLGFHIGVGLGGVKPNIPVGLKYLVDLGNHKSYFESGIGVTLVERGLYDDKNPYNDETYYLVFIPSGGYNFNSKVKIQKSKRKYEVEVRMGTCSHSYFLFEFLLFTF
jgi:hypothetical protein